MKLKNNTFYILRHGETVYQTIKKGFIYPLKESIDSIGITKKGRETIKKVIPKIKKIAPDFIYCSDFKRTRETALIITRGIGLKDDYLILTPKLRDINLGVYQGGLKKDFYRDFPSFLTDFNQKPKKGESLNEAKKRIMDFIRKIDNQYQNKKIIIVSHGEILWLLEGVVNEFKNSDLVNKNLVKKNYIQPGELRKLN